MAAPMQTFNPDPHYPISREIVAPQWGADLGGGALHRRRRYARPTYRFRLRKPQAIEEEGMYIRGFMAYHQGDIPFWWDGGPWGVVALPVLVGFGDGVRTQFFLPNRHITVDTRLTYADEVLDDPQPTIDLASGLLTYATAPADQAMLTATYECLYKVVFDSSSAALSREDNTSLPVYAYETIALQEFVP